MQRRSLLKKAAAAGAVLWAAPTIDSFVSVAAAASGTATVPIVKSLNGNNDPDPPLPILCTTGGIGNSIRGSAVFTRTENPAEVCVEITLTTGTSAVGRKVYILQSSSTSGCLQTEQTITPVGTWAASPALGPQTFCTRPTPVPDNADTFVAALQLTGGGGVDGWSSHPASLP